MPSQSGHRRILAAALLWASAGIAAHAAPDGTSAAAFGTTRLLLGGGALVLAIGPRRFIEACITLPRRMLLAASLAMTLFQWSFFAALHGAGVSVTALVSASTAPFFADAIESITKRRPHPVQWRLAALCYCAGILLLGLGGHVALTGLLLALASGIAYAAYTLAAAQMEITRKSNGVAGTALALLIAGLSLMPAAASNLHVLNTARGIAVAVYLGLGTTALAYGLFVSGLREVRPGAALVLLYAQPMAAMTIGLLVLKERLAWVEFLGIALV